MWRALSTLQLVLSHYSTVIIYYIQEKKRFLKKNILVLYDFMLNGKRINLFHNFSNLNVYLYLHVSVFIQEAGSYNIMISHAIELNSLHILHLILLKYFWIYILTLWKRHVVYCEFGPNLSKCILNVTGKLCFVLYLYTVIRFATIISNVLFFVADHVVSISISQFCGVFWYFWFVLPFLPFYSMIWFSEGRGAYWSVFFTW